MPIENNLQDIDLELASALKQAFEEAKAAGFGGSYSDFVNSMSQEALRSLLRKGGRVGYGLGDLVGLGEKTGVVHPNPDKVATGNGFMGSLIPRAIDSGILSIPQSPENKLQQAYAVYVASGGDLEYEEWKTTRTSVAQGGRIGMLGGGLLRTGIMEILWPLLKEGGRRGTLGDARAVVEYAVKSGRGKIKDISEIMKKYKFTRAVGLAKDVKKGLLEKIKGYKEGFQGGYERVGDWKGELKWLIKETREDIKKVDEFLLKKEAGAATKHAEGGRIGFKEGTKFDPKKNALENWWADQGPWAKSLYGISSLSEFVDMISPFLFEKGGRVGFKEGTKDGEGIMSRVGDMVDVRNIPYYAGEGLKGLVNSVETLSKFPLAAGELGSKLIQQPGFKKVTRQKSDDPMEELFLQQTGQDYRLEPTEVWGEALENITPGSWSENLGLTSLVEGMGEKRPKDAQTVGGILSLGTEVAVPTGGAFKAGQFLLNKASKAMGKVKDGKNLNKLIDEKLTDFGQSRRDFNVMAGTSGLMIALKSIGLGGLFKAATKIKPSDDVVMRLRTWIDDSDVDTEWGLVATGKWAGAFDVESLSTAGAKTLKKIMGKDYKVSLDKEYIFGQSGELGSVVKGNTKTHIPKDDMFLNVPTDEASYIADALKKAGHKVKFEHIDDGYGSGVDYLLQHFKKERDYWKGRIKDKDHTDNYKKFSEKVKKMTEREKIEYHSSITDDYGYHINEDVKEVLDILMPIKKAEGGRIGLGAGGPPISGEELKQIKKESNGSGIMDFLKITGSGGMGSNKDIYDQGQQIPGLDQKQYNYGFGVDANIPFNLPGGGKLEIGGGTGFGRGRTETTYKGEPVPGMSGMGESRLGDQWNIDAKITYPFADGGLTKTIPPERGPDPQGLPSALYNGIMRPRSY